MADARSVLGTVSPAKLGHCQIHEHIFVRPTPMSEQNPALTIDDPARSVEELGRYAALGGASIVDAQPVGAGRDAEVLARLSRESAVEIIASTGYHILGFYPGNSWIHALDEEGLADLYRSELSQGMLPWEEDQSVRPEKATGLRAGLVKAAIPAEGAVGRYEMLLSAAARAAAAEHVPLMLHTEKGENTLEAIRLCFDQGVVPEQMIVCHVDRQADDFAPHEAIAATGVYLDYDTVGRFKYHSDEAEIALLRHMAERGYAGRILLSLDTTAARLTAYGGEIGLTYLFDSFLPALSGAGFGEEQILRFTRRNAAELFSHL